MVRDLMRPRFVGIAGGSGSGKSTITNALMAAVGDQAVLLQHDWYYRDQSGVPQAARATTNYDHPDAQETSLLIVHLEALYRGEPIEAPQYDFATHTRTTDTVTIPPRPLLVVEGINTLSSEALRSRFDLTVFVDTPSDIRFIRRLQRDIVDRGRTVESVIRQYIDQVRPMHEAYVEPWKDTADLVLSGEVPVTQSLERILACLGLAI